MQIDKNVEKLIKALAAYRDYFKAIERGEYETNRRSTPLRSYEQVLQIKAYEALFPYEDSEGHKTYEVREPLSETDAKQFVEILDGLQNENVPTESEVGR